MDQQRESEIVNGLRQGDADAWRALYDAHAETIWRYVARRMMPRTADVADVVQETFLAAARSAGSFDSQQGPLLGWLMGVARRHVALYYRKQQRQDQVREAVERLGANGRQLLHWLDNQVPNPPDVLESREMTLVIRATLSVLTDEYEQLLMWKYLDGEPVSQIAARLEQSETAVRSKLARARKAFRTAFSARVTDDTARRV